MSEELYILIRSLYKFALGFFVVDEDAVALDRGLGRGLGLWVEKRMGEG